MLPIDGAEGGFGEQELGVGRELGFGVTHGGEGFGVVYGAPIALTIDQWIATTKGLRHMHHGFVTSAVAVWVEFAEDVADGARRFFVFGAGVESELAHGVEDAALHGFEAVAKTRQGSVEYYVHRVIQVGVLGVFGEVAYFDGGKVGHLLMLGLKK